MAEDRYGRNSPKVKLLSSSWENLALVFCLYLAYFQTIINFKSVKFRTLS